MGVSRRQSQADNAGTRRGYTSAVSAHPVPPSNQGSQTTSRSYSPVEAPAPRVRGLVPGSPAARAGIEDGDEITAVDGHGVTSAREVSEAMAGLSGNSLSLTVMTAGGKHRVVLEGASRCSYPVDLSLSDAINAFADGRRIGITTGMMRFVESDDELALVVGHELAHNVSSHIDKQQANTLTGILLGDIITVVAC